MTEPTRLRTLNPKPIRPDRTYVLYWMQQSQRANFNPALEHAIELANQYGLPVVVAFGLMDDYPEATQRHYAFMLEGLADTQRHLAARGIKLVCGHGEPKDVAVRYARNAAAVVTDRAYLRHLRAWRDHVAGAIDSRLDEVEGEVVVPVEVVTNKPEVAARTLRPRLHRALSKYLVSVEESQPRKPSLGLRIESDFDPGDTEATLARIHTDRSVQCSAHFRGGHTHASRLLDAFIEEKLVGYHEARNEPADAQTSTLAPYLQYGHISPVEIALRVRDATAPGQDRDSYIEELIVRRELSHNHCHFNARYDQYAGLPAWARRTLDKHAADPRPILYTDQQLADASTHDPYWNAAQLEAVKTGYMHNYMRMYWGKKVVEWSPTPAEALRRLLWLNNRFFLCGLNANTYGNCGWVLGLHDRPWTERPVFGQTRYMNAAGLERKFDIDRYVKKIASL